MRKWLTVALAAASLVVLAVAFSPAATGITLTGFFVDDDGHLFEGDIDSIAEAGITKGCNPPTNNRYCPDDTVDRGQMAAFLRRALDLPNSPTDHFTDDNNSTFENDINAIAEAGITKGCNPPANNEYCPTSDVSRGEMAAFLRRALNLPGVIQRIPLGSHGAMTCSKDGERCSLTVDLSPGRRYLVREGLFQVTPASDAEQSEFSASSTSFALTLNGSTLSLDEVPRQSAGSVVNRYWQREIDFAPGTHTLVGRWRWNGQVIQTSTITVRTSG